MNRTPRDTSVGLIALALTLIVGCSETRAPKALRTLDEYELTSSKGERFGSQDLKGAPYIVSFFFTSCATVCPPIMEEMKAIETALASRSNPTRLVSITVDPEHDTPGRLTEYAKKLGADLSRWTFLTGSQEQVKEVVVDRLLTHMGEEERGPGGLVDIGHGSHTLVMDGSGRLRAIHQPEPEGRTGLLDLLDLLVAERP